MKSNEQFTVITPIFNARKYLAASVESVIAQSYPNWNLVLVDDGSTDDSLNIAQSFADTDSRISVVSLSGNSGAAVARNTAIENAQGRYIAFLDADDIWLPQKLEHQLSFMKERGLPFIFSSYEKIDHDSNIIGHMGVPDRVNYKELMKTNVIGCLTAVYDTNAFGQVKMRGKPEDYGLWLDLLREADFAYGQDEVLARYRVHSDSVSANKLRAATNTWNLYRNVQNVPLYMSVYYFSHYVVRGFLRSRYPALARKIRILN